MVGPARRRCRRPGGLAIAGLAARLVAPAGSPVPAVGELIINVLPGPLVNFGKETLGKADKPVLLAIIVVAVLIICGFAGQARWRRALRRRRHLRGRCVLGLVGVAAQPDATFTAYVPTIVGLLLGYMILSTLISKLQQWRLRRLPPKTARLHPPPGGAFWRGRSSSGQRSVVAAVTGQVLAGASSAVDTAREKLRLRRLPRKLRQRPPPGADLTSRA